jgi:SAM-dependent methyltransferase
MSVNWDQQYHEEQTPWDKGAPAPPLLEWFEAHPLEIQGRVFVPGCGLGHDVRAIATRPEVTEVIGFDISPRAIDLASSLPRAGVEYYETGDLFALGAHHLAAYDWAWEHTCFCAIPIDLREAYVEAMHSALKPGGCLLGAFYLNPYDDEHQPGDGPPHGSTLDELIDRFTASEKFSLSESYIPTRSYPGREGLEQVLRLVRN